MPKQKATSAHKDMRDARREEKKMVDVIADTVLYTLYFICTFYYKILLNYLIDGGWECRYWPLGLSENIKNRNFLLDTCFLS